MPLCGTTCPYSAKAAIDIAIRDLIGKAYGMRVCDMLGGATSERVSSYYALTVDEPDEVARTALDKEVWEATGCTRLAVDANRALTTRDVLRIERECGDILFVFEQPRNTMEEISTIRGQLRDEIYIDENTDNLNRVLQAISLVPCH